MKKSCFKGDNRHMALSSLNSRSSTAGGFTLVELMIVIAIIGILAAISAPNYLQFRAKGEYAALVANVRNLLDAQDLYLIENGHYHPYNGKIKVPSKKAVSIPELGFSFSEGHPHTYLIRTRNVSNKRRKVNYLYLRVIPDRNFYGGKKKDQFIYITYMVNGETILYRDFTVKG